MSKKNQKMKNRRLQLAALQRKLNSTKGARRKKKSRKGAYFQTRQLPVPRAYSTIERRVPDQKLKQVTFDREELLMVITSDGSGGGDHYIPMNPGDGSVFTWIQKMAVLYQKYKFNKLSFSYRTSTATSANGTMVMGIQYDRLDAPVTDPGVISQLDDNISGSIRAKRFDLRATDLKGYLCVLDDAAIIENVDLKTYTRVCLNMAWTDDLFIGDEIGRLYVKYSVTLQTPTIASDSPPELVLRTVPVGSNFDSGEFFNPENAFDYKANGVGFLPSSDEATPHRTFRIGRPGKYRVTFTVDDEDLSGTPALTFGNVAAETPNCEVADVDSVASTDEAKGLAIEFGLAVARWSSPAIVRIGSWIITNAISYTMRIMTTDHTVNDDALPEGSLFHLSNHELRRHDVRFIHLRKLNSRRARPTFPRTQQLRPPIIPSVSQQLVYREEVEPLEQESEEREVTFGDPRVALMDEQLYSVLDADDVASELLRVARCKREASNLGPIASNIITQLNERTRKLRARNRVLNGGE